MARYAKYDHFKGKYPNSGGFRPYQVSALSEYGTSMTSDIPARSAAEAAKLFAKANGMLAPGKGHFINVATGHQFKIAGNKYDPKYTLTVLPGKSDRPEELLGNEKGFKIGDVMDKSFSTTSPPAFVTNFYVVTRQGKDGVHGKLLESNVREMTEAEVR